MQNQQPSRLEILVRKNRGRTEHKYYTTELSHRLKLQISPADVLDLEETDRIAAIYYSQAKRAYEEQGFAYACIWGYEPIALWFEACRRLGEKLYGQPAVLFVGPYEYCGAVRVSAHSVLNEVASLLEFDRDSVALKSATADSGLLLDLYEEGAERLVELVAWGEWEKLAMQQVRRRPEGNA